jgi:hypothetical protein
MEATTVITIMEWYICASTREQFTHEWTTTLNTGLQKSSKNLGAASKFQAPEGWQVASAMLKDMQILGGPVKKKKIIRATYSMEFEHPCALYKNYGV